MSKLDPAQTIITLAGDIPWRMPDLAPPDSVPEAVMAGSEDGEGAYLVLMKWYPGWMSAPHTYVTDRFCVVISGVWWCNSGPDFDPGQAVPVYPGGFVHRVAGTPHYDGARADAAEEPAVIAVSGIAPVSQQWVEASQPVLRQWRGKPNQSWSAWRGRISMGLINNLDRPAVEVAPGVLRRAFWLMFSCTERAVVPRPG